MKSNVKIDRSKYANVLGMVIVISAMIPLFSYVLSITTLGIKVQFWILQTAELVMLFAALGRIILLFDNKWIWCAVVVLMISFGSWASDYFQYIALFSIGCVGLSYRKVLSLYLIVVGTTVAVVVISAMSGGIVSLVYNNKMNNIRSSMGICYPTDYASIAFFLLLVLWTVWEHMPFILAIMIAAISALNAYYIARSFTSTACSILLLVAIVYLYFEKAVRCKRKNMSWIKKTVDSLCQVAFPLFSILYIGLIFAYLQGFSFAYKINNILSGRILLAVKDLEKYQVSAFGSYIIQSGNGFSVFPTLHYQFIDSSYPRILLMYGVLFLILYCILWPLLTRRAILAGNRKLMFAAALVAVHALSEHHFTDIHYNIFLALPFADLKVKDVYICNSEKHPKQPERTVKVAFIVCFVALILYLSPPVLSKLRIVALHLSNSGQFAGIIFLSLIALVCIVACTIGLVSGRSVHCFPDRKLIVGLLVSTAGISVMVWNTRMIIDKCETEYADLIESDRQGLEFVLSHNTYNVYVSRLGELYRKYFPEISLSSFDGEDLAHYKDATIVVNRDVDSPNLFGEGYLYCPISEEHVVYSSDPGLIEALQSEGYTVTGFCTYENSLDLMAKGKKDHPIGTDNQSVLPGAESSSFGLSPMIFYSNEIPRNVLNLYPGDYTVTYHLSVEPEPFEKDYVVCKLKVSAYGGEMTVREVDVYRSWFDDRGKLSADLKFSCSGLPNVSIFALNEDEQEAKLSKVSWKHTPMYDIRPDYNADNLKLRDIYYDRSGNRTTTIDGFSSLEYDYYDSLTVKGIRYLDLNGEAVNTVDGFSELRRTYNDKRQLVREEYLNTDHERVTLPDQYAMLQWEYGKDGYCSSNYYCNTDGSRIKNRYGYAEVRYEYDDYHRVQHVSYYDEFGEPVVREDGYAGITIVYEEDDNDNPSDDVIQTIVYTDINGNPTITSNGFYCVTRTYNDQNAVTEKKYCDISGKPVMRSDGYAVEKRIYDCAGNVWSYRYLDTEDNPVMTEYGYAEVQREYDQYGHVLRESYYDTDGSPCLVKDGFSVTECQYDEDGTLTGLRYYDLAGQLVHESSGFYWLALELPERKTAGRTSPPERRFE